jgi:MarR family transcriptional regulator, organic hydroperoxide resistance regulator
VRTRRTVDDEAVADRVTGYIAQVAASTDEPTVPSTGYMVWRLAVKWRAGLDRALYPLGLTSAQYGLLASLHALSRSAVIPSQRQLADFSGLEPMFVSKLLRALERSGLVERTVHPGDPRARSVSLSTRGTEVLSAALKIVADLERRRLAALGGQDSAQSTRLRDVLQTLLDHPEPPASATAGSK